MRGCRRRRKSYRAIRSEEVTDDRWQWPITGVVRAGRRITDMRTCKLNTRAGQACPFEDLGRGLCHLHDPDALYARQHPLSREKLLRRPDVVAILDGAPLTQVRANHCVTCKCVTTLLRDDSNRPR